jgi:putative DNA methylase
MRQQLRKATVSIGSGVASATLLPDPGDADARKVMYRRLAGEVVDTIERKKIGGKTVEKRKRETIGGVLHWGRESNPDFESFRQEIRKAHGGRTPRVLAPFAGGGAIPLEAMRLGCEVTAIDINPVAWFLLRCTLEYPQKFAGWTRRLPQFALQDRSFMGDFLKAKGFKGAGLRTQLERLGLAEAESPSFDGMLPDDPVIQADLAWHVRAFGQRGLAGVQRSLADRYPVYAEFMALKPGGKNFDQQPIRLLQPDRIGHTDAAPLNSLFDDFYLNDPRNPRWVATPTVAYLWARTVRCKGCRSSIPLLKTRWLAKKDSKRVVLKMEPNGERNGVMFSVEKNLPQVGVNAAQRREHDKRIGAGTMSRSGAQCPCCPAIMTTEDIRLEAQVGRLGATMFAVVVDTADGKSYRAPTDVEQGAAQIPDSVLTLLYAGIPFGLPTEPISRERPSPNTRGASGLPRYAIDQWRKLFMNRQLLVLGHLSAAIRNLPIALDAEGYSSDEITATISYSACALDRLADANSSLTHWQNGGEFVVNTFQRFVLPMNWDFSETNPFSDTTGNYRGGVEWVAWVLEHALAASRQTIPPHIVRQSALKAELSKFDVIVTDPPYYDAIPYSDLMDFFHVWLRRTLHGLGHDFDSAFEEPLGPKWKAEVQDGELVDQPGRFGHDSAESKRTYENGMAAVFAKCHAALNPDGRLVIVFANKNPNAWETLVSALIRAGFVVDGSWPIQTERGARTNAIATASLASSVWLVCKKRLPEARPGWDNYVLSEMREKIRARLRTFWDAGIRGPDFVWAATGPAMEAFSQHPVVKKADHPAAVMAVSEFLREVRRIVVDFVVGRVLTRGHDGDSVSGLDDVTTYYLLHRHDFDLNDAPVGACILYAQACTLSDSELADRFDLLVRTGGGLFDDPDGEDPSDVDDNDDDASDMGQTGKGNKLRLKPWNQRKAKSLGYEMTAGRSVPLIDQVHRLMHLWREGDQAKVDDYLDGRGLKRNPLFAQLLQALIELAPQNS